MKNYTLILLKKIRVQRIYKYADVSFYKMIIQKEILEKVGKRRRINSLKRVLPFFRKNKLLDVGCKFGHVSKYFSDRGYVVDGIDINKDYITKAKKKYKGIKFFVKDITRDIKKRYDMILLIGVLEEINFSPTEVLKRLKRNLNAHGRIFIVVRNARSLKRRIKSLLGLEPVDILSPKLWVFTKKRLVDIIDKANYRIIKVTSNKSQSFKEINISVPDNLAEEIFAIVESKKVS